MEQQLIKATYKKRLQDIEDCANDLGFQIADAIITITEKYPELREYIADKLTAIDICDSTVEDVNELYLEELYLIRDGLMEYKNNTHAFMAALYINSAINSLKKIGDG